jgi:2-dehydro-3-deoxyphosphogluconate aldolase/(4S)-4-hydroxy-2-oxoglutarate aldolase
MTPGARTVRDRLLADNPIIPVLTIERVEDAVPLAKALVTGGVRALEITLRTPAAIEAAAAIRQAVPEAITGIGTVRTPADLDRALQVGAQFLVSPGTTPRLLDASRSIAVPLLPGVATASEIAAALDAGFDVQKFFPAVPSGGMPALKAFAGPFPDVRFCPTGGIGESDFVTWLGLKNVSAVGGSWLAPPELVKRGDWAGITQIAARSQAAVRSVR